jgi:hypothetical protein
MVEFALVLPFLVVLIVATAELAKVFNYFQDMTHLATTTARYAAVGQNPGPEASLPSSMSGRALNAELRDGIQICLSYPDGTAVGDRVHVEVTYEHAFMGLLGAQLPIIGDLPLDGIFTIDSQADMRLETPVSAIAPGCGGAA